MYKVRKGIDHVLSRYGGLFLSIGFILVALFYGISRIFCVDFSCINGDYQTYNALRRVLDGQLPYTDFANYLGMGPIVLQVPLLSLHNSFAGSLFVTHFVATLAFMLLVYLVFYLVAGRKLFSGVVALLLPKLISSQILRWLIPLYGEYTENVLGMLNKPNNSERIVRMVLPVLYSLFVLGAIAWQRRKKSSATLRDLVRDPKRCAALGFIVGLGLTWSNDFSFACIGSATLVLLILAIADRVEKRKKSWNRFLGYLPGLLLGMFGSMWLASGGHPLSYLAFTKGVASWQFWYYGLGSLEKIYSLTQLLANKNFVFNLCVYLTAMAICLIRLCQGKAHDRLIVLVFLYTSVFAAQFGYILGSGGNQFTEGTAGLCILLFWALVLKGVLFFFRKGSAETWLRGGAVLVSCVFLGMMSFQNINALQNYRAQDFPSHTEGYLPALEGVRCV